MSNTKFAIVTAIVAYLLLAFISSSFNPKDMDEFNKAIFCLFWVAVSGIKVMIFYLEDNDYRKNS